jgi:hypothetical protein
MSSNLEFPDRMPARDAVARPRQVSPARYVREQEQLAYLDKRRDDREQSRHLLSMHQLEREAHEGAGEVARDGFIRLAQIDAGRRVALAQVEADGEVEIVEIQTERKVLTEAKHELRRAHEESLLMAGDDLELQTMFLQMDAGWYRSLRLRGIG